MATTITGPSTFHSAFNPIIFTVSSDVEPTVASYTLKIGIGKIPPIIQSDLLNSDDIKDHIVKGPVPPGPPGPPYDENIVSLTRPFIKVSDTLYEAKFELSGAIRNYFKMIPPLMTQDIEADKRLYVQYYVGTTMYVAINAVFNIGEDSNMEKYINTVLTSFHILRKYENYDFDVSILFGNDVPQGSTKNAINRIKEQFIPRDYLQDEKGNDIVNQDGDSIVVNGAKIVQLPTPRNPFYIRWINRLGGVDYWMFGQRQNLEIAIKDINTLSSYYETTAGAIHSETTYGVFSENTVLVGADNLTIPEWNVLSMLPMSPQIEWYNEKLKKWQVINIKKGDSARDTSRNLLSIEFVFSLPSYEVQF